MIEYVNNNVKFCVLGAGNGGLAAAGHAKMAGFNVALWNRSFSRISHLVENPYLELAGKLNGTVALDKVTDDLADAIQGASVISVMTTCDAYEEIAVMLAPHLVDGQMVLLNSEGVGGGLLFNKTLVEAGNKNNILIGMADICVYGCKLTNNKSPLIKSIKNKIHFSTINPNHANAFLKVLNVIYPQFVDVKDPLATGLWFACGLHTVGMVLNAERIRRGEDFLFYVEGFTPEIARYLKALDGLCCLNRWN
ncbi:NAD(P)-binding domain-containing protein [Enterovibrio nigricans]|uniref:NAD binding domain of 6-phosphogluconate dehydrogenase n=1 Tax=Enterovibrio nigricans DSM 22720 TaxID=1121868 RepID=A0A1T4WF66_9GAMM|nr:NAD(P)-binding domain-containing protein [Enterovibrio nigricans]PKF48680.1 hypothetical protein AT251_24345 [Enterovibrio nigricans]SKA75920.1 NAD binding domain of 6-phosphogluconate dehydrogenase [Enterovibrio nigricans DSM 22720]